MDKLEKFINDNREALNAYDPDPAIWERIKKPGPLSFRQVFNRAAMIIIIIGISIVIVMRAGIDGDWPDQNLSAENPDLKETEIYYNNKVQQLMDDAQPLFTANPDIERELMIDIKHLDSICMEIKEDLKDNISNQEVIGALVMNYRIKIDILEEILEILGEQEKNFKEDKI